VLQTVLLQQGSRLWQQQQQHHCILCEVKRVYAAQQLLAGLRG
jgi:hypothetical protein